MTNSTDFKVVAGLLAFSLAVGGAGVSFPRLAMLLQILALAGAGYFLVTRRSWKFQRLTSLALVVLGGILLLPLLQLIPLPPAIWTQLPGRELPQQLDQILGSSRWRPLSLDVEGTIRSFLTLLPAAVVFLGSVFLSRGDRARLLWVVFGFAVLGAILGIIQVASGGWVTPYPSGHLGTSTGLFVNRNHNAALLLTAIPVTAALAVTQIASGKPRAPWIVGYLSAIIILAIAVLGTTSRMGLLLLPFAVLTSLALLLYRLRRWSHVSASAVALGTIITLLLATGRFDRTLSRFSGLDNLRQTYWTDLHWALDHFGLVGAGIGTFLPVYQSAESLEAVVPPVTNHAHNDYLELLLEGGLPAVLLFVGFLLLMAVATIRSFKSKSGRTFPVVRAAAVVGIAIFLAASVVDYPLRMPAIAAVLALFCAILLPSGTGAVSMKAVLVPGTGPKAARGVLTLAGWAVLVGLFVLVVQAGLSAARLDAGHDRSAVKWASWSTEAHERLSTIALLRHDFPSAISHGTAAIALSPISVEGIRSVGLARIAQGAVAQGNSLMQIAVVLGWRDPLSQLWAIEAAKVSKEPEKVLQRAEALFRRNVLVGPATTQLLNSGADTNILPLLAQKLAQRPPWRTAFFKGGGDLSPATASAWLKLVALLEQSEAPVTLQEGQPSLDALLAAGRTDDAQRLWELLQDGDGLISNGDFESKDTRQESSSPVHWYVPRQNRPFVKVAVSESGPDSRAVRISGAEDPLLLRQELMLKPGAYQLSYRARITAREPVKLRWELRCRTSPVRQFADAEIPPLHDWLQGSAVFTVPGENCAIQRLALTRTGPKRPEGVWLDDIRLRRVVNGL